MTGFAVGVPHLMIAVLLARFRLPLFLLVGLVTVGTVNGAEKAGTAASVPASRTRLLTPAELRDCNAQESHVLVLTDEARKEKAAIEIDKGEIARVEAGLAEQVTTLDKTSAEAVGAYNAEVEARDKLIDTYRARVTAFNLKADAVNATRDAYAKACDKRRYDERDLNDIKRKK